MSYKVKYKLPGDPRYLYLVVEASNQAHAKKIAQAQIPSAIIVGGPQQI